VDIQFQPLDWFFCGCKLLVIIRGEDVGLDFPVDVDFQICLSSSMVRAGLDFRWMQIFEVSNHPSLSRWIGFSVKFFSLIRPLDWISVDADFRVLIIHV
jgi:hypothetical protein